MQPIDPFKALYDFVTGNIFDASESEEELDASLPIDQTKAGPPEQGRGGAASGGVTIEHVFRPYRPKAGTRKSTGTGASPTASDKGAEGTKTED